MSFMFKPPKLPDISTPPPPTITTPPPLTKEEDIEKLKEEEKKKIRRGREKRSTLLTGPQGILTPARTELKSLLGE